MIKTEKIGRNMEGYWVVVVLEVLLCYDSNDDICNSVELVIISIYLYPTDNWFSDKIFQSTMVETANP